MAYPFNSHYVPQMANGPVDSGVPLYYPPNVMHPYAYSPAPYAAQVPVNSWVHGVPQWGHPGMYGYAIPSRPVAAAFPAPGTAPMQPAVCDLTAESDMKDAGREDVRRRENRKQRSAEANRRFEVYRRERGMPYPALLSKGALTLCKKVHPLFKDSGMQTVECANPDVEVERKAIAQFWSMEPLERMQHVHIEKRAPARHRRIPELDGQWGVYATAAMPMHTVLGRYEGVELTKREFADLFTNEKECVDHQRYTFGAAFDKKLGDRAGIVDTLMVDPLLLSQEEQNQHLLMYVNDCRAQICRPEPTEEDLKFINVQAIEVHLEGWPAVFFLTTRDVRKGEELALNYGAAYSSIVQKAAAVDAMDVDE